MIFDVLIAQDGDAHLLHERDGRRSPLGHARWLAPPCPVDEVIADAAVGPVLDIGCGPGRLLDALTLRGKEAMGIDLSPAAVALARGRGRNVLLGSVFDSVPGHWATALLLDGSVGIGGNPAALLKRVRALADVAIVEVDPPGAGTRAGRVRIEAGDLASRWFDWAHVDATGVGALGDLQRIERIGDRWFAWLR